MAIVLGMNAILYYQVGGIDQDEWLELTNCKDVKLDLQKGEADVTTRANGGYRANVGTLKEGSVDFGMVYDTADAGFIAIKTAFLTNAVIGLAIMDGDIETPGSQGLMADFSITNFSIDQPLEEASSVSVTAKITYSDVDPSWETIPEPET